MLKISYFSSSELQIELGLRNFERMGQAAAHTHSEGVGAQKIVHSSINCIFYAYFMFRLAPIKNSIPLVLENTFIIWFEIGTDIYYLVMEKEKLQMAVVVIFSQTGGTGYWFWVHF